MVNVVAQHRHVPVAAGGLLLQLLGAPADVVHLHGQLLGLPGDILHLRLEAVHGLSRRLVLGAGQFQLGRQLPQHRPGIDHGVQPQADFQLLFLPGVFQEFLGLFRLLGQRAHPLLQLL